MFVTVDLDDIVERLEEEKIISIKASLELEGEEAAVVEEEFNQVRKDLSELVLEKFFEPAPNPNEATPDDQTVSTVLRTARQIRNIAHHWPSVGYSRREVSVEELRSIQVDYTVNKAVSRKIAPQAHISLFFEDFGLTKEDVVTVVDGNDALWNTTTFDALAAECVDPKTKRAPGKDWVSEGTWKLIAKRASLLRSGKIRQTAAQQMKREVHAALKV